ncbi:hypothetical protein F5Y19DRAFT_490666 [Xylariaceae sp. FL1651]|nr:hypothetical protein F5Y19DRAFT_490666 [Xylariaceae sp. FL1651]
MSDLPRSASPPEFGELVKFDPLDLQEMRDAAAADDTPSNKERKERRSELIRRRAMYHTFSFHELRGEKYGNCYRYSELAKRFKDSDAKLEYFKPNPDLAYLPEKWFANLHRPFNRQTEFGAWYASTQDLSTPELVESAINYALQRWPTDDRARLFDQAIESIEKPERIKKIVTLGLGRVIRYSSGADMGAKCVASSLAYHVAAIKIAEKLKERTGQDIALYAADAGYGDSHKRGLENLSPIKFKVLDASYHRQEQWSVIDDSTLVIADRPNASPWKVFILEYARPVAFIGNMPLAHRSHQEGCYDPVAHDEDGHPLFRGDMEWRELYKSTTPGEPVEKIAIPGSGIGVEPMKMAKIFAEEYELVESFPVSTEGEKRPYKLCEPSMLETAFKKRMVNGRLQRVNTNEIDYCPPYWVHWARMYKLKL